MKIFSAISFVSLSEVIDIHEYVINRFGGRAGIHDQRLLESAINYPLMMIEFGDEEDCEEYNLAAAYFFHIIKNHPFLDGNKRTGLMTALDFFDRNGFVALEKKKPEYLFEELYELALNTAMSQVHEKEIAAFFRKIIKKTSK
jgi:death-on-curing protein